MKKVDFKKLHELSPFEVKDLLIKTAQTSFSKKGKKYDKYLNAGRGNPNFFNTIVREAFVIFSNFAVHLAASKSEFADVAFRLDKENIYKEFQDYINEIKDNKAADFLKNAIDFAIKEYKFEEDEFVFEFADAALGDFYPMPPRIFPHVETIVTKYLEQILCPDKKLVKGEYDVFATEGATAAMIYIFNSLKYNNLVTPKDKIAIITPIFSPYLEIPKLHEFQLEEIFIEGDEFNEWQIPDSEIEKLKDPSIKALYMVNPTNPTSIAINDKTLKKITDIVEKDRKDLIVITDTVYSNFIDGFHSVIKEIPKNTICVYSYSKYFGVTGYRLGVIMLHEDCIIDKLIKDLPEEIQEEIDKRYLSITTEPRKIKFIDRLEMDSRDSALAHTGGLSCPLQVIMALFSLYDIIDVKKDYKKEIHGILVKRITNLYENLHLKIPNEKDNTYYYALIDIKELAKQEYSLEFAEHLTKNVDILEFLFKLAEEKFVVCLPGEGFKGPNYSLRVSLANLIVDDYMKIGKAIKEVLNDYHKEFKD
ncbi:MAG: Bifunctional aspartate aminotransferase and L-aspartate beta-decarboxylase [Candidatus Anoxychlamydiales bacterium]|nr:Bifunctional aspartate aminotransferase and L-aspartate beta-decarboxylase [Candidatus Anoxychlamydiales bacterium]